MYDIRTPLVIGLGELLWDEFPEGRLPGGAPANVAFHAEQLGCRGIVASRVGTDDRGGELGDYLLSRGLRLAALQWDREHPTGRVTVDVSDAAHPNYTIHENVAWDFLEPSVELLDLAGRADAICFGTLAQRAPVSRAAMEATLDATRSETLIVCDVNLRQQYWSRDVLVRSIGKSDIVKLNGDEVRLLAPVLELPAEPVEFAAALRRNFKTGLVCITRAEHGCLLLDAQGMADVPGVAVDVVDAVGAGDAFTAALIWTQFEKWPLESAARFANEVGALVATRRGAMPPLADEYRQLREQHRPDDAAVPSK